MAFALTKFRTWGARPDGPQPARGIQYIEMRGTGTTADVIYDFGDFDGTFWGDADATDLGVSALAAIQLIEAQVHNCVSIGGSWLRDRVQVASLTTTGQYLVDFADSDIPNVAVNASDGETAFTVLIALQLNDGIEPVNVSLG